MTGWPQAAEPQTAAPQQAWTEQERNAAVRKWLDDKAALDAAKAAEAEQRQLVVTNVFPNKQKGTQRCQLDPAGYALKFVHGVNYTLGDKDKVDGAGMKVPVKLQVEEALDRIAALGPEGVALAENLVKWKPELAPSVYEGLEGNNPIHVAAKQILDPLITTKDASPQLTFETPKEAK